MLKLARRVPIALALTAPFCLIGAGVASAMPVGDAHAARVGHEAGPRGPRGFPGLPGRLALLALPVRSGLSALLAPLVLLALLAAGPAGPPGPSTTTGGAATEFHFGGVPSTPSTTVATLDGLTLNASCSALGRLTLIAQATDVAPGVLTVREGLAFSTITRFGTANTTFEVLMSPLSSAANRGGPEVRYISNAGKVTTISVGATDAADGPNGLGSAVCAMFGTAITF